MDHLLLGSLNDTIVFPIFLVHVVLCGQVHGPTELVTSSRRPVPLVWHFSTRYGLNPLLNEQGDEMNW